jgi:hypothetical protein
LYLRILIILQNDNKKRKTRSGKFPLTLHPTRQFCKKIRGRLYYLGNDKKIDLQRYLEQAAYLHSGKAVPPGKDTEDLSIRYLCNLYLEHQQTKASVGQIKTSRLYDQTILLRNFVRFVGPNRMASDISIAELKWDNLDLTNSRVIYPRGKTGIQEFDSMARNGSSIEKYAKKGRACMLDLYYHLHDDDSQKTMRELAKSGASDLAENNFENSGGV